jgi:hypothetical protein
VRSHEKIAKERAEADTWIRLGADDAFREVLAEVQRRHSNNSVGGAYGDYFRAVLIELEELELWLTARIGQPPATPPTSDEKHSDTD